MSLDGTARVGGGPSAARISEVRRQIAGGTYLTDEKLDLAVERMLDELCLHTRAGTMAVA
jgi:hypothetical protein